MSWTIEEDEILINFVRKHEVLYNVKSKNYRKSKLKLNLWREIGTVLNKSDSDCTKRWAYVRDYYIRRRGTRTGSSGESAKKRANLLSFLDNFSSSQKNTAVNVIEDENSEGEAEMSDMHFVSIDDSRTLNEISLEERSKSVHEEQVIIPKDDMVDEEDYHCDRKRKRSLQSEERLQLFKQISPPIITTTGDNLNETDYFFMSMAKIIKKLPPYEQAELRMQIASLVGNAELRNIRRLTNESLSEASSSHQSAYLEVMMSPQSSKKTQK